ncbi:MAG: hypothetical protein AB1938_15705 [Myxococcota bacterium]
MADSRTNFTLTTLFSPAQVREVLAEAVHEGPLFSLDLSFKRTADKEYRGELSEAGFRIIRRTAGRNSFVPVVTGEVRALAQGAEVKVSMALPKTVSFIIGLWTFLAMGVLAWFIVALPPDAPRTIVLAFAPFPLLAMVLALVVFNREVSRAASFLKSVLPPALPTAPPTAPEQPAPAK